MRILCMVGVHSWKPCKCESCGMLADLKHRWGKWKCDVCGKVRDSKHEWSGSTCSVRVETRDRDHAGGDERCRICGAELPTDQAAKRWALRLREGEDYQALAAYLCAYHSLRYQRSVDLYKHKRRCALAALREAGATAIDAMLAALDAGEIKDIELAEILVEVGDPKAVPLLKRILDRGEWDAYSSKYKIRQFVDRYPEYHGEVEKVTCAICGRERPVTDTKQCGDKRFCVGVCWSKRGRVLEAGSGTNCPNYEEGICVVRGRDTGLCSLGEGKYYATDCYVYRSDRYGPQELFRDLWY